MGASINQKAKIRTNPAKDSICKIDIQPVKFASLWTNYPDKPPYVDPKTGKPPPGYSNQCAIKVSVAIHRSGIEMKSFTGSSRILVNSKNTAALATELAAWLKKQPFCGLPQQPTAITGENWDKKITGTTGIVYFADYWLRSTDKTRKPTGDHIDLWNGSRITATGLSFFSTFGRIIGIDEFFPGTEYGFSDLRKSSEILFWEIK